MTTTGEKDSPQTCGRFARLVPASSDDTASAKDSKTVGMIGSDNTIRDLVHMSGI